MKSFRNLSAVILCAAATGGSCLADTAWRSDYAGALSAAKRAGRPVMMDFSATWCGPCREMERTTFKDSGVVSLMARCVCVRIDIDEQPDIAKRFGVNSIPRVIVVSSGGKRLLDSLGYREPADFKSMLGAALSGKPVVDSAAPQDATPPEVKALESHVRAKDFAAWRAAQPAAAARALKTVLEQLGAFEATERDHAASLLSAAGRDGVDTLVAGLTDQRLAVRVGASDTLARILTGMLGVAPASIPRFDPWAASPDRAKMAKAVREWWEQRRKQPDRVL